MSKLLTSSGRDDGSIHDERRTFQSLGFRLPNNAARVALTSESEPPADHYLGTVGEAKLDDSQGWKI